MAIPIHSMHGIHESQVDRTSLSCTLPWHCCAQKAPLSHGTPKPHNGLAEWRGLSAACDSYNKGRQRVRMQHLLQLKRSESTMQMKQSTDDNEKERIEVRQESGRRGQDWCHTCVGTASIAEPLPLEIPHLEELRAGQDCAIRMLPNTSGTPPLYPWTSPC